VKWCDQLAEELHQPVKRKVIVRDTDKIWPADLIDMQALAEHNDGIKYLLTFIDVFLKYGWIVPLKHKTGTVVASALQQVFRERKPERLWVDKGKEFYNKDVQKGNLLIFTPPKMKQSPVWSKGGIGQ